MPILPPQNPPRTIVIRVFPERVKQNSADIVSLFSSYRGLLTRVVRTVKTFTTSWKRVGNLGLQNSKFEIIDDCVHIS